MTYTEALKVIDDGISYSEALGILNEGVKCCGCSYSWGDSWDEDCGLCPYYAAYKKALEVLKQKAFAEKMREAEHLKKS